jgi:hypothetical protein
MDENTDDLIRKINEGDQLASSIKQTAAMTVEIFKQFRESNEMTRKEAFVMTQTWLTALLTSDIRRGDQRAEP